LTEAVGGAIADSRALLLRADKIPSNGILERVDSGLSSVQSIDSSLSMHRIQALTAIERVDLERRQVTLRESPRTATLEMSSNVLMVGLKVGDSVCADFVETTAIHVSERTIRKC
jgi:hypothetical protein